MRNIANKRANIELMRLKILSHRKECESRNAALKKEKDNIARSYTELKKKMLKFREEEVDYKNYLNLFI